MQKKQSTAVGLLISTLYVKCIMIMFCKEKRLSEYLSESKSSGKSLVVKSFQILVSAIQTNISIDLLFLLLHLSLIIYNHLGNV